MPKETHQGEDLIIRLLLEVHRQSVRTHTMIADLQNALTHIQADAATLSTALDSISATLTANTYDASDKAMVATTAAQVDAVLAKALSILSPEPAPAPVEPTTPTP